MNDTADTSLVSFPNSGTAGEWVGNGPLRKRFMSEKDSVIESALGKKESWAKKVCAGDSGVLLEDIPKLLDVLGLKLVDKNKFCVDREVFLAYRTLASASMNERKLEWEE